jgi:hypothetical protein
MFVRTQTGYRVTFEQYDSPVMTQLARGYFHLLSDVWSFLTVVPLTRSGADRFRTALRAARLASQYVEEMNRCFAGRSYFAAGVIGCAVIESLLLLACMRDRDVVLRTRAWKQFATKQKRRGRLFSELLFWIDLGHLILIGEGLGWFNTDSAATTALLASYPGSAELFDEFPELKMSPLHAVSTVHEIRNHLHPGKMLRGPVGIDERTAKLSVGLVYVSLAGVLDFYRGDPMPFLDIEIPLPIRNLMDALPTTGSESQHSTS